MQQRVLHIKLVDGLGTGDGQRMHCVDNSWLDHWAQGLIIVDAGPLDEATNGPTSLVSL
jgi:hypothetical protein